MYKIYSTQEKEKLLHIVMRCSDIGERTEICPSDNFIQCASMKLSKGTKFKPHIHIYKERHYTNQIAQESWVVIKGRVKCYFYDINGLFLESCVLRQGDTSFTLHGGHTYEILEDDTIIYEYKTGPYEGQEHDKVFI